MTDRCPICSFEPMLGRFCPECGTERVQARARKGNVGDPFVGRVVAGRYEVGELISVGGMGRVHRGIQRSLDRAIAIKFIHSHLLTSTDAVTRFMNEARAASRLNHPNVVSVFDFGRTAANDGNDLYIVMELLTGSDLAGLMAREYRLSIARAVDIVRQTLAALAEAHAAGVVHRDVKPENVFVTPQADADQVKVIDFGLASVQAPQRITREGHAMGTPAFMAPEQVRGELAGPAADQYAVGVMLFELLAGALPFDGSSTFELLQSHLFAPRPDPRTVAPDRDIPAALAEVCMRAMAVDPARRFADAREMSRALVAAVDRRATLPLVRSEPPPTLIAPKRAERAETLSAEAVTAVELPAQPPVPAWRDELFRALRDELLGNEARHGVVLVGRPGVGCSFLSRALAQSAADAICVAVDTPLPPHCNVSGSGLRRLFAAVNARVGHEFGRDPAALRVDAVISGERHAADENETRAALLWAFDRITAQSTRRAVVVIDDVDRMDTASIEALRRFVRAAAPHRSLRIVLTCERLPPGLDDAFRAFAIKGSTRAVAEERLRAANVATPLVRDDDDIEPLYVEELLRWGQVSDAPAPIALADLVEARIQHLGAQDRLVLQSIALTGGGKRDEAAAALADPAALDRALPVLEKSAFVVRTDGEIRVAHPLVARVVLSTTPSGALESLHSRAADGAERRNAPIEVRLHHALRGRGDLAAFLLAERAAVARASDGDVEAAIAILADALHLARLRLAHGEGEAAESANTVFARKLGELLVRAGRVDEAHGVVAEALSRCDPRSPAREPLLELSKSIAQKRVRGVRPMDPGTGASVSAR